MLHERNESRTVEILESLHWTTPEVLVVGTYIKDKSLDHRRVGDSSVPLKYSCKQIKLQTIYSAEHTGSVRVNVTTAPMRRQLPKKRQAISRPQGVSGATTKRTKTVPDCRRHAALPAMLVKSRPAAKTPERSEKQPFHLKKSGHAPVLTKTTKKQQEEDASSDENEEEEEEEEEEKKEEDEDEDEDEDEEEDEEVEERAQVAPKRAVGKNEKDALEGWEKHGELGMFDFIPKQKTSKKRDDLEEEEEESDSDSAAESSGNEREETSDDQEDPEDKKDKRRASLVNAILAKQAPEPVAPPESSKVSLADLLEPLEGKTEFKTTTQQLSGVARILDPERASKKKIAVKSLTEAETEMKEFERLLKDYEREEEQGGSEEDVYSNDEEVEDPTYRIKETPMRAYMAKSLGLDSKEKEESNVVGTVGNDGVDTAEDIEEREKIRIIPSRKNDLVFRTEGVIESRAQASGESADDDAITEGGEVPDEPTGSITDDDDEDDENFSTLVDSAPEASAIAESARIAAYVENAKELHKWRKAADNVLTKPVSFPLNESAATKIPVLTKQIETPMTALEKELGQIMSAGSANLLSLAQVRASKVEEDKKQVQDSLLLSRKKKFLEHSKLKRQAKIKSKTYHKILKKEKLRHQSDKLAQLMAEDPTAAAEYKEKMELERITERMTLKHKGNTKWNQQIKIKGLHLMPNIKRAVAEQRRKGRELLRKDKFPEDAPERLADDGTKLGPEMPHTSGDKSPTEVIRIETVTETPLFIPIATHKPTSDIKSTANSVLPTASASKNEPDEGGKKKNTEGHLLINPTPKSDIECKSAESENFKIDESQKELQKMAFIDAGFAEDEEEEKPPEPKKEASGSTEMPGWGDWAIDKIKLAKKEEPVRTTSNKIPTLLKKRVILQENKMFMVDVKPHGVTPDQYDASMSMPLGREWQTLGMHAQAVQPRVTVKRGKAIDPMDIAQKSRPLIPTQKQPTTWVKHRS
ncbi:U3 small nucleolar RNA-associated protein 14 [Pelomyxa schiedti]|nr:U3 small nucleolar RNA-associated protein 14 [Pelomyxa schiedti]